MLSLPSTITRIVPEEERSHCISDCVAGIKGSNMHVNSPDPIRPFVSYSVENKLRPVISDKEGIFVIIPDSIFSESPQTVMKKN